MKIAGSAVRQAVVTALEAVAVPTAAASAVADHLLVNERLGRTSHGLFRLPGVLRAATSGNMAADCEVRQTSTSGWVVEAGGLPGIFAMQRAIEELVRVADERKSLVGIAVRGYRGTTGSVGIFALHAARHGLPAIATCNSEAAIAAPDATNPIVGTNPIAYAFPAADGRIVVGDYASSVWSYGDIAVAGLRGKQLPAGVVQDAAGSPSVDPEDADAGSMLPSGGPRGFAQSLLVELLCGALVGGKVGNEATGEDAALLLGLPGQTFDPPTPPAERVSTMLDQISGSTPIDDRRVRFPGERYADLSYSVSEDTLEVDDIVIERLRQARVDLK